jgi:hypothetical protein
LPAMSSKTLFGNLVEVVLAWMMQPIFILSLLIFCHKKSHLRRYGVKLVISGTLSLFDSFTLLGTLSTFDSLEQHGTLPAFDSLCLFDTFSAYDSFFLFGTLWIVDSLFSNGALYSFGSLVF